MIRYLLLLPAVTLMITALVACAPLQKEGESTGGDAATATSAMSAAEFRAAAETRFSWRDPDFVSGAGAATLVRAKLLGFNDFHGGLNSRQMAGRPVGGAAVLAAYLKAAAADARDGAIIVHAGDFIGASPPVSALMQDEPAINFLNGLANENCRVGDVLNALCNVVGTLGNHEFDEGKAEIHRLLFGGNHADGPYLGKDWTGARVPYVSANVLDSETGEPVLPRYVVKRVGGVSIGFIGATLRQTPMVVSPAGVAGFHFADEVETINAVVAELKAGGIRAIVVTIHQGLRQTTIGTPASDAEEVLEGAIIEIVSHLDAEIDVVVSGHAHAYSNAFVAGAGGGPILLTQAFSNGTAYSDIDIAIDPASGDIVEKSAAIITTWADRGPGLTPDAAVSALVAEARVAVAPRINRVIATTVTDITRAPNETGESALGNLVTDAFRAATGADFAVISRGGVREDIIAGEVLWGELFAVQPFGNDVIKMTLTGTKIRELLNQQWTVRTTPYFLQISGLRYTWDDRRTLGDKVVDMWDAAGALLESTSSYTMAVNNFMSTGGDGFLVLTEGRDRVVSSGDLDALIDHIQSLPQPFSAAIDGRIRQLDKDLAQDGR